MIKQKAIYSISLLGCYHNTAGNLIYDCLTCKSLAHKAAWFKGNRQSLQAGETLKHIKIEEVRVDNDQTTNYPVWYSAHRRRLINFT